MSNGRTFARRKRSLRARLLLTILPATAISSVLMVWITGRMEAAHREAIRHETVATLDDGTRDLAAQLGSNLGRIRAHNREQADQVAGALERARRDINASLEATRDATAQSTSAILQNEWTALTESLALLSTSSVIGRDYQALNAYVKAVTSRDEVVFAIFFNAEERPLTRTINRDDPRVQVLLAGGSGPPANRLLAAKNLPAQFSVVERPLQIDGQMLGKVVIGFSLEARNTVVGQMDEACATMRSSLNHSIQEVDRMLSTAATRTDASIEASMATLDRSSETLVSNLGGGLAHAFKELGVFRAQTWTGAFIIWMVLLAGALVLLTRMVSRSIQQGVHRLSSESHSLHAGSQSMRDVCDVISENASSEMSAIEEISASLEQSAAIAASNLDRVREAATASRMADAQAAQATDAAERMRQAMEDLEASRVQTEGIVSTIEGVAMQTNLLALNAAVESARAGEHGASFGVVADEVRSLAGRSSEAAKQARVIIERSRAIAHNAEEAVLAVCDQLKGICSQIEAVRDGASASEAAIQEQNIGISEIKNAVHSIEQSVQANVSKVAQSVETAEQFRHQAGVIADTSRDILDTVGRGATQPPAPALSDLPPELSLSA